MHRTRRADGSRRRSAVMIAGAASALLVTALSAVAPGAASASSRPALAPATSALVTSAAVVQGAVRSAITSLDQFASSTKAYSIRRPDASRINRSTRTPKRLGPAPAAASPHAVFTVDTNADAAVATPSPTDPRCAAGNSHTCTFRQAVADAASDTRYVDEVLLPSGTHVVLTQGAVDIESSMEIVGTGASVSGGGASQVLLVGETSPPAVEISGLEVTGGYASPAVSYGGGGIACAAGALVLSAVDVSGNVAADGRAGGIYAGPECQIWIDGSTVTGNAAGYPFVAPERPGTLGVFGLGSGGGIYVDGSASIEHSTISANTAATGAGLDDEGNVVISATAVDANTAMANLAASGVGIFNGGVLDVSGSSIEHNTAADGGAGGGLFNGTTASLTDTAVSFNRLTAPGGVTPTCVSVLVACGAGIASMSVGSPTGSFLRLAQVALNGNSSSVAAGSQIGGGALFCDGGYLYYAGGTIDGTVNSVAQLATPPNNSPGITGGAIFLISATQELPVPGSATIDGVTVSDTTNAAPQTEVQGGAMASAGDGAVIESSTFTSTQNTGAAVAGGALIFAQGMERLTGVSVASTASHALGTTGTSAEILGGAIADLGGLGALDLEGVHVAGTTAVAQPGTSASGASVTVVGGDIIAVPAFGAGGFVADDVSVTDTDVAATGPAGVVAGGGIATVIGSTELVGTQVLGTQVSAGEAVGGGLVLNGASGFVGDGLTLGASSVTAGTAGHLALNTPANLGSAFLNISGVIGGVDASGQISNGTFSGVSTTAPNVSGSIAFVVAEAGDLCGGSPCSAGLLQLTNSTIAANPVAGPTFSASLSALAGPVGLRNTIVAAEGNVSSCVTAEGAIVSAGHNLDSGHTCGFTNLGDLQNTNPMLLPLADNGGPVETMALTPPFYGPFRPGSPAIDAGSNIGCPATDARGVPRPQSGTCDIGAYELAAQGYWLSARDGGLFHFGAGHFMGSVVGLQNEGLVGPLGGPITAIAATADQKGYFQVGSDGGVFAFGDAHFDGSLARLPLAAPVVGAATDSTGLGYWTVDADGRVSAFGDAKYYGSEDFDTHHLKVVGIAGSADGLGYWLATAGGQVLAFGDAASNYGSPAASGIKLGSPLVGIVSSPEGRGYWLVAADGGVFAYGAARFFGSMGGRHLNAPVVAMAGTPDGLGYWLFAADGGVFNFGDAKFIGSMVGSHLRAPVSGGSSANA